MLCNLLYASLGGATGADAALAAPCSAVYNNIHNTSHIITCHTLKVI